MAREPKEAMRSLAALDGCYEAARAAALAGVPKSTVYEWARKGIVVPSVSPVKEKLWSYGDLMALRIVYWLRHPVPGERAASTMAEVRAALKRLDELGLDIWTDEGSNPCPLVVGPDGRIWLPRDSEYGALVTTDGDLAVPGALNLLAPFSVSHDGVADHSPGDVPTGPDLVRPRNHLRIAPGRVSGEPHVHGSRLTTVTISALSERGFNSEQIAKLYPDQSVEAIEEAIDLERTLELAA